MRGASQIYFAVSYLVLTSAAESRPFSAILESFRIGNQKPLQPHEMPPTTQTTSGVIISDVIGKTQTIAIFSGLTREIASISVRLNDAAQNATVLAPDNTVMRGLKRKPWENPEDYDDFGTTAYEGPAGEDRAQKNLEQFVQRHIVPASPWEEGQKIKTIAGNEIWWENKDGNKKIQPGDVPVTNVADKVANGEVWVIGGSLA